ncbi:c-type cytochrome [Desertivirga arenae]|uniref:c-type cytochrome n=1 Tax=Desertivirga arenae TaxID=2810309 RepID=UPI001A9665DD|nr:cytochrome c [Pedobacter sp. SYSU D00823]
MKRKLISSFFISFLIAAMSACGSSDTSSSAESESSSTAATPATTESTAVSNPEDKSDSKGVGRFSSVEIGALDAAMATKGEAVFTAKCAACHKTTGEKLVGPGLKGVTQRRTPEWIMNMITNPEEMTKNDPVAKALFEKHLVQMTFQNVNDEETRQILEFFRKNDQ